jgi:eukaryotic-like serine/threonine-protein kinase
MSGDGFRPATPTPDGVPDPTPPTSTATRHPPPTIPDHELIRRIGAGAYGEVWLARNTLGAYRAVKVIYRSDFDSDRPYDREFDGIRKAEPVSRTHESQVDILHVGRGNGHFYYVMELADGVEVGDRRTDDGGQRTEGKTQGRCGGSVH